MLRYYNYVYFRNIEVHGLENIPKDGGVLFSPNHQGAFLDPLLIGSMTPSKITSLTRSDVFGGPFQWFFTFSCAELNWPVVISTILRMKGHQVEVKDPSTPVEPE